MATLDTMTRAQRDALSNLDAANLCDSFVVSPPHFGTVLADYLQRLETTGAAPSVDYTFYTVAKSTPFTILSLGHTPPSKPIAPAKILGPLPFLSYHPYLL